MLAIYSQPPRSRSAALNHWITEFQHHGAYVRYTDDFLLFGNDKRRLWELQALATGGKSPEQLVKVIENSCSQIGFRFGVSRLRLDEKLA